ncbi:hypothetical protein ID866_10610 [Astraeus odoratus]|nr:hypothetical protein ID866_10610 [Astraeus odoratus]
MEKANFEEQQSYACADLILCAEASQFAHMTSDNPHKIWEELKCIHEAQGLSTQLITICKFTCMEKQSDQSMSEWIGEVCSHAFLMQKIGIKLEDIFSIIVLTSGLPSKYDSLLMLPSPTF